jgi:GNAT superfamily N-acetyltransferase
VIIRQIDLERDAPGCVAIYQEVTPFTTMGVEAWVYTQRTNPERARHAQFVAVDGERVLGFSYAGLKWYASNDSAYAGVSVLGACRSRGIGAALWDRATSHLDELGVERVSTMFTETPEAVRFAQARGFRQERAESMSSIDPRGIAPPQEEVLPLCEVDPRDVYDVDVATTPDVPMSDQIETFPYDEWLKGIWQRPAITLDGSFGVVVDDGKLAAFTLLAANRDLRRAYTEYTATLREFRGRGFGERVKRASLAWAAANGIERVWTTNDETNEPMLGVNRRLGYEVSARRVEYLRTGTTTSPSAG